MLSLKTHDPRATLPERELFARQILTTQQGYYVKLQTCNRVELYLDEGGPPADSDQDILRHLAQVASGLHSTFVGENQIQQQVKAAYEQAVIQGTISSPLHFLFQQAIRISKQVRTRTTISRGAMSHSQGALEVIRRYPIDLTQARITLVGVNQLSRSFLFYLKKTGARSVYLANRHYEKAQQLAMEFGARACRLEQLSGLLKQTDILLSATQAPHYIVSREWFPQDQPMLILDLAVPRDVDPAIGQNPNVILLNLSDIEAQVSRNRHDRSEQAQQARLIVDEELAALLLRKGCYATACH